MIKEIIAKIIEGQDLSFQESCDVFELVMTGQATPAQIGALLIGLRMKGETADEVAGAASVMREKAMCVQAPSGPVLDTCGTGGDGLASFNISTAVALVAAGAGVCVAKHGNRSVSSKSGSADALMALGVNLEVDVPTVEKSMVEAGVGFLFAPLMHGAMKHAIGPRREIGVRSIFNMLGPLTNPAGAKRQLLGTYSTQAQDLIAQGLARLGTDCAWVVHSEDGMDELSLGAPTRVLEVRGSAVKEFVIKPEDFGLVTQENCDLAVDDAQASAAVIRGILAGEIAGAKCDIVLLNVAAALIIVGKTDDKKEALALAREAIASGAAREALANLVRVTSVGTVKND